MYPFELMEPEFRAILLANAPLETLGRGFRWLEGPVWFADQNCLLLSDIPNDRVLRWSQSGGMSIFRQPSHFENGHARDRQGRLISCSHQKRSIMRTELTGEITVLASHFHGRRLNAPNDVVVKSDGSIWFTDPLYGISTDYEGGKQESELPPAVYRLDPNTGDLEIVADDFKGPNGLCFSPNERHLYITETGDLLCPNPSRHIRRFTLTHQDQSLTNGRIFHVIAPGAADGLCSDEHGHLFASAEDGVHCLHPSGALLGKVHTPEAVSNLTFGGRHLSRLFLCAGQTLYAVYTNTRGAVLI